MDSPDNGNLQYETQIDSDTTKLTLIDTGVQLDLIEEPKSDTELIQTLPNGFVDVDMKMPITIQNCVPLNLQVSSELVVIANAGANFLNDQKLPAAPIQAFDAPDALSKQICIEQDGRTYVLSLQDGIDGITGIVELRNKNISALETQILDTQENVSLPSKQGINQNWFTSRAEKATLHNKGHVWKQGMWGKEEIELLENNIRIYCEEHDITNPATIIFEMSKDERKDFYRTVAKGLNRPLFSVYRRVIRMYDNKNHVGKYTLEELEKLKKLRSVYGHDWQAIGTAMGRSASSIKDRCRLMKDNCNQGKWLPAEERRLAEAVYELADALPGEMISSGLSWAVVAERVGTRSEKQCRTKWLNYLNWKEAGGTEWTREDDVALICRVCSVNAVDENHVDWSELAKGWSSVRSPQWLRGKWWNLKRHVPNASVVSFQDICEFLYKLFVLKIQGKEEGSCTSSEDTLPLQPSPLIAQPKPTILQTLPDAASAGIVISNVGQTCNAPVVSLSAENNIGLEASPFSSVRVGPMLQTLEVLPQNVQLAGNHQTFLSAPHPSQTLPLTTTLGPNQIIIHTVTANDLHGDGNIAVRMDTPTQVIIDTSNRATLTSLASTQIPSAPPSPEVPEHSLDDSHSVLMEDSSFEAEVMDEQSMHQVSELDEQSMHQVSELDEQSMHQVSELDEDEEPENNPTSHIILSDPMLAASHSPDIGTSDVESEKTSDECLDHVSGSEG